jgi:hypothetical protein
MSDSTEITRVNPTPRRDPYRLTGEVFGGRYRLEGFAGAGSFGAVYRATDTRLGRTVAVKILKPDIGEDALAGARELFQREALTAGRLVHPHIVAVTDTGEESGFAYMVMEWLEGRTLDDELRARAPLALEEALALLGPITDALQTAHDSGVIHRDIKPSNIHLGRPGRTFVKVLDFGIAKVLTSSAAAAASRVVGTLFYMSPEQLGSGNIDRRADIYSLGVMLYQMLSGMVPFQGETQGQIIQQHIIAPPPVLPPLQGIPADRAPAISQVIQRAMAKRAEERQQSAHELYQEFAAAVGLHAAGATGSQPMGGSTAAQHRAPQTFHAPPQATAASPFQTTPLTIAPTIAAPHPATTAADQPTVYMPGSTQAIGAPAPPASGGGHSSLKPVFFSAIAGAVVFLGLSIGLGFLSRALGLASRYEPYDDFVLELIPIALRDTIFGALLGASLSELRPRARPRWGTSAGQQKRALLVYAASGAALFMFIFVLLRTSMILLPLGLAIVGALLGLLVCGARIGAEKVVARKR